MYLDFETYQNMGGTLEEATFNEYEFQAETIVNWYTFNRLMNETTYPTQLTRLMYTLVRMIEIRMNALTNNFVDANGTIVSGAITRQANDGVSIEFNNLSASTILDTTKDRELGNLVRRYLFGIKNSLGRFLTYRGLYPGE